MELSSKNVEEFCLWLKDQGVPESFCGTFKENMIDGEVFLTLTEKDVKEMVSPIGVVKKILKLQNLNSALGSCHDGLPVDQPFTSRAVDDSEGSLTHLSDMSPVSAKSKSSSHTQLSIPNSWRPEVQLCIQNETLDTAARNEIARTLVSILFSEFPSPTRPQCGSLARRLILQYPFMKDDLGNGYQSWEEKMVERVRNVIKRARKKRGPSSSADSKPKRQKSDTDRDKLLRRYPIGGSRKQEDSTSFEQHLTALSLEMMKAKPRDSVILPLMKVTYPNRRELIESDSKTVQDVLTEFHSALKRPSTIEQEMTLVTGIDDVKNTFLGNWKQYVPAILCFAEQSGKKHLLGVMERLDVFIDDHRDTSALEILSMTLARPVDDACIYVYQKYSSDVSLSCAIDKEPIRNSPRIVHLSGEDRHQYFVVMEHKVLCEVSTLQSALFFMFCAYYVFNLEYPKKAIGMLYFFQDYILSYPDSMKRPGSYISVVSDLKNLLD